MLTKKWKIIEVFTREPWKKITFRNVKDLSKNKSDNYVHSTLKDLVKNGILKEERIGNVVVYSPDNNAYALNTLGYISENKANLKKNLPFKNINNIIKKIKTSYYTFIITGSYAKCKQKEKSDLDVVIICDSNPKKILSRIKLDCDLMIPKIHPYVFTESEFYEMLVNKEENYGKETARNNLIITGGKEYYGILMMAIENGFNG